MLIPATAPAVQIKMNSRRCAFVIALVTVAILLGLADREGHAQRCVHILLGRMVWRPNLVSQLVGHRIDHRLHRLPARLAMAHRLERTRRPVETCALPAARDDLGCGRRTDLRLIDLPYGP